MAPQRDKLQQPPDLEERILAQQRRVARELAALPDPNKHKQKTLEPQDTAASSSQATENSRRLRQK